MTILKSSLSAAEFCERMTRSYDERLPPAIRDAIAQHVVAALPAQPHIIDLGCGPGLWLRDVAAWCPDATLTGYDQDATMLAAARGQSLTGAQWHQADINAPDFTLTPASADVISLHYVLHFFNDPRHLLRVIHTALRPGGALVVTGWVRVALANFVQFWHTMNVAPGDAKMPMDDPDQFCYQRFAEFNRYTLDDEQWLLAQHGFTVERAEPYASTYAYVIARSAA